MTFLSKYGKFVLIGTIYENVWYQCQYQSRLTWSSFNKKVQTNNWNLIKSSWSPHEMNTKYYTLPYIVCKLKVNVQSLVFGIMIFFDSIAEGIIWWFLLDVLLVLIAFGNLKKNKQIIINIELHNQLEIYMANFTNHKDLYKYYKGSQIQCIIPL